jgi:hypothetical protein
VKIALYLLGVQGLIGAFDTIYYHEWKARLPARGRRAARELALHAARDFLYGVLFISLRDSLGKANGLLCSSELLAPRSF